MLWRLCAAAVSLVSFTMAERAVTGRPFFQFDLFGLPAPAVTTPLAILTGFVVGAIFFWNGWSCEKTRPKDVEEPVLYVVLLFIGFLYTRYQDKIRDWL